MAILAPTPPGAIVTLRHFADEGTRAYAEKKLRPVIASLPHVRTASVEISFQATRPRAQRYAVQVTLAGDGTLIRVEERAAQARAAIDAARGVLQRRIRDWKGRVYFRPRQQQAAAEEAAIAQASRPPLGERQGGIVRRKCHEIKPLFPEDAVEQMELLGHTFFLFLNAETGRYSVVYRRTAGGYGLIEPAFPLRQGGQAAGQGA